MEAQKLHCSWLHSKWSHLLDSITIARESVKPICKVSGWPRFHTSSSPISFHNNHIGAASMPFLQSSAVLMAKICQNRPFSPIFSCSTSAAPCIPLPSYHCQLHGTSIWFILYAPSYDEDSSWSSLATESTLPITNSCDTSISSTSLDQSLTISTYTDQSIPHTSQYSIILIGHICHTSDSSSTLSNSSSTSAPQSQDKQSMLSLHPNWGFLLD